MVLLSEEFVKNINELSPVAVKCYIVLREYEELKQAGDNLFGVSYDIISTMSGIKSHKTIREALLELAINRWIEEFKRGGYESIGSLKVNFPNKYKISRNKVDPNVAREVYEKMKPNLNNKVSETNKE